ncbi:MAG: RidA family protein [Dehalococcoidia bacterium]|nr:RidA family protein [Dehalococcoidia bacterium]
MMAEFGTPEGLAQAVGYTHVVSVEGARRLVFVAGQVATDASGALVGEGDIGEQARQVYENLGRALAAAGARYSDVLKTTTFIVDYKPDQFGPVRAVRSVVFPQDPPANTTIGVSALFQPGYLIEVEAIAVVT